MKKLLKKISKSGFAEGLLCHLVAWYIRVVYWTNRWHHHNRAAFDALVAAGKPCVVVFWHGRLGMIVKAHKVQPTPYMLISKHRDGRLIARTIGILGYHTIAGSSSRGGMEALREIIRVLKAGHIVGITPDGPRGPRMHLQKGAVQAARLANVPIVPLTYATSRRKILRSWDKFHLPLPFGRGVFVWGSPVHLRDVSPDGDVDAMCAYVEAQLNQITADADATFGHAAIVPAATPVPDAPEKRNKTDEQG